MWRRASSGVPVARCRGAGAGAATVVTAAGAEVAGAETAVADEAAGGSLGGSGVAHPDSSTAEKNRTLALRPRMGLSPRHEPLGAVLLLLLELSQRLGHVLGTRPRGR
jgi:hypothetical protein